MTTGGVLEFVRRLLRLKNVQRAGWRIRGIRDCESVADHTCGTAVVCMLLCDILRARGQDLDAERVLRLALLHDWGEAVIGDIPQPADSLLEPGRKAEIEEAAVQGLTRPLGSVGAEYLELWREYESAATPEARLVRAADKLEMLMQAAEYEHVGYRCLGDFWEKRRSRPFFEEFPPVAELVAELESRRPAPR